MTLEVVSLGFDAGKTNVGWTALRFPSPTRPIAIGCGVLDRGMPEARELLVRFRPLIVAVELPDKVFPKKGFGPRMAGNLAQTARMGGRLEEAAESTGAAVYVFEAAVWRAKLLGAPRADDDMIARWVMLRIPNWPARTSSHENDSCGAAVFAHDLAFLPASPAASSMLPPRPSSKPRRRRHGGA